MSENKRLFQRQFTYIDIKNNTGTNNTAYGTVNQEGNVNTGQHNHAQNININPVGVPMHGMAMVGMAMAETLAPSSPPKVNPEHEKKDGIDFHVMSSMEFHDAEEHDPDIIPEW